MSQIDQFNFSGKKVLVRVDFNVPMNEKGEITDDTRMRAALPTLQKIVSDGGLPIVVSHMGRPKGVDPKLSLSQIASHLQELTGKHVLFVADCMGPKVEEAIKSAQNGEIILLENLRFYEEEEGKPRNLPKDASDEEKKAAKAALKEKQKKMAQALASIADIYVNDAFGTAHRAHASTAVVADFFAPENKMFGYLMQKEVNAVDTILSKSRSPFTAVIGGAKISSKIGILINLLDKVDNLIIVGGMAYTFVKAQGGEIGKSLFEEENLSMALDILDRAQKRGVKIYLPEDSVCTEQFDAQAAYITVPTHQIPSTHMGMDIGEGSVKTMSNVIESSQTILWNGPAGVFEFDRFAKGSEALAQAVARATSKGAYSLVGGGDSVACINKLGLADQVSYVSTGGGALLEAIEGKVLPGIAAIQG